MDPLRKMLSEWLYGLIKGRLTTAAAFPMLFTAIIQVLYNYDTDPETVTDWNTVLTMVLAGFGLTAVGPAKPDEPPPPPTYTTTKPAVKRRRG
jgi:hypothetical protein